MTCVHPFRALNLTEKRWYRCTIETVFLVNQDNSIVRLYKIVFRRSYDITCAKRVKANYRKD